MKIFSEIGNQKHKRGGMREGWPYYCVFSRIGGTGRGEGVGFATAIYWERDVSVYDDGALGLDCPIF